MKKIVVKEPGDFDQLVLVEAPAPEPGDNEVGIRVEAAGVNFADCLVRMGVYPPARKQGFPLTPGMEVAGVVTAVGTDVVRFAVGDRVIAVGPFDGYASYRAAPQDYVFPMPADLDFVEAAALPRVCLPAYYALHELAHVQPGEQVLIHAAAGGVGTAAVQMATLAGARVIAVVGSADKVSYVRDLGAEAVIDRSAGDLWKLLEALAPNGVDVVLDPIGGETARQGYEHLAIGGRLIVYGMSHLVERGSGQVHRIGAAWRRMRSEVSIPLQRLMTDNRAVMGFVMGMVIRDPRVLRRLWEGIAALIEERGLRIPRVTTYPLAEAKEAHRALQSGQTVGKLVLLP